MKFCASKLFFSNTLSALTFFDRRKKREKERKWEEAVVGHLHRKIVLLRTYLLWRWIMKFTFLDSKKMFVQVFSFFLNAFVYEKNFSICFDKRIRRDASTRIMWKVLLFFFSIISIWNGWEGALHWNYFRNEYENRGHFHIEIVGLTECIHNIRIKYCFGNSWTFCNERSKKT